ncbi:MAG: ribonuclease H-like domain-containing protein [Patescibacteria group bacterium]|nr:ribonuclease H-like domain-containing protein [Patescibacteria group bacterium]
MDTLVIDIETQNFFTDPAVGRDNFEALKISVVGAYSYLQDAYFAFGENEMEKVAELFAGANRIVGFCMNRYDVPVLNNYFHRLRGVMHKPQIWNMERIDLLEKIESAMGGQRISLSRLAEANLGVKKGMHGSMAIALYREGKMDELRAYCLNDVKLTKELFDLYESQRFFLVPDKRNGGVLRVEFAGSSSSSALL